MGGTARMLFLNPDQICLLCHFYSPQPTADTAGTSPAWLCVCVRVRAQAAATNALSARV